MAENAPAAAGAHPLDDVMLAMDVVDTLRRKRRLVDRELDEAGREEDLKERLRKIYAAQGIEVSDAVLDEGVKALKEDRFVYKPPQPSLGVTLARVYVSRGNWGKWVLWALAALAIGIGAGYALVVSPRDALPQELQAMHAEIAALAQEDEADRLADRMLRAGQQALRENDSGGAQEVLRDMTQMRDQLQASYGIRIVNRPGERSGVFRIPDINQAARNYYIIVEAVDDSGRPVRVPIKSEETGKTERVTQWGIRVPEDVYNRVAADKQDDGIIQANIAGRKDPGYLEPTYRLQTTGAAITAW